MSNDLALDALFASEHCPANIYVCYSNLHAIQACLLSADAAGICLYSDAVSAEYLRAEFNGQIHPIIGRSGTLKDVLSLAFKSKKYPQPVNVFVGCKVGYAALAVLNQFPQHRLYLLDDGLAMYGLSQQQPQPSSTIKRSLKLMLALLLRQLGATYFSGDAVSSLDRQGVRLLFYPQLYTAHDVGTNQPLSVMFGSLGKAKLDQYRQITISSNQTIYVASYEKSVELAAGAVLDQPYNEVLLHPRVAARNNPMPLEVYLPQYQQITMGMSSIMLVLAYIGYRGHVVLDADDHTRRVMDKLRAAIDLPFTISLLGDTL